MNRYLSLSVFFSALGVVFAIYLSVTGASRLGIFLTVATTVLAIVLLVLDIFTAGISSRCSNCYDNMGFLQRISDSMCPACRSLASSKTRVDGFVCVADLAPGRVAYTVPWALETWRDQLCIRADYRITAHFGGTGTLQIWRIEDTIAVLRSTVDIARISTHGTLPNVDVIPAIFVEVRD